MPPIHRVDIETWTRDEDNAGTDDQLDVIVAFQDGRSFRQRLNNAYDNFERGQRDRFTLDLSTPQAATALVGQTPDTLRSITVIKASGSNMWKCEALGLRVNDVVVLSRYAWANLDVTGDQITVTRRADGKLDGLELELRTANVPDADTDDPVYCNVIFSDGTTLYSPKNLRLDVGPQGNDFERNNAFSSYAYMLPLPSALIQKSAADVAEVYVRKSGTSGWLLKSARLLADGDVTPVIAAGQIHQFIDTSSAVLGHDDWSSRSIGTPSTTAADVPWPTATGSSGAPVYQISGPVLGHVSDGSARIVYRVERDGTYKVKLFSSADVLLGEQSLTLAPTGTFQWTGLSANTHYRFRFYRVQGGADVHLPEGDGAFRTAPPEGTGVKLTVGVGSCCRNSKNTAQPVWSRILDIALDPAVDPAGAVNDLRFFIHMGDTFYLYDEVTGDPNGAPDSLSAMVAANLSSRKHPGFLQMARRVPCYAVWDDHDFRYNDKDSAGYALKDQARQVFLSYWGNPDPAQPSFGLTTRWSHGNIDFYLMDGRYNRQLSAGVLFGAAQRSWVINDIVARGPGRLRVLVSGSTWNHTYKDDDNQAYGSDVYDSEREAFYAQLASLLGSTIKGLVLLAGDVHRHEIYEVALPSGGSKVAPEIVCSPLAYNSDANCKLTLTGERKRSEGKTSGFASLHFDTRADPWTLAVKFRRDTDGYVFIDKTYTLGADGQFRY